VKFGERVSRLEGSAWRRPAQRAYLAVHHAAARLGVQLLRASYDSPIPRPAELTQELFRRESPMRGIAWDPEGQLDWVERELAPFLAEFRPQPDPDAPPGRFRLENMTYDSVDAELLYGILRWARPRRYVELGSGYSTLVAAEALAANEHDGHGSELSIYDPFPSAHVQARPELSKSLRTVSAQELPEDIVSGLGDRDILFVDTSHTVKMGGDVNRIVLDLLPLARPGVMVHFHDIFLPVDYSSGHVRNAHYWNEQYLLQAFLSGNPDWEVLVGAQAIARVGPDRLARLIPSFHPKRSPGAFWIRRKAA
jgi:predicted O-methyltransferase YrrM